MNMIKLNPVTANDAAFLFRIMNMESIRAALQEPATCLRDWQDAIAAWSMDADEEDYMIVVGGGEAGQIPAGWLGINGLSSSDGVAYLKVIVLLPDHQGRGIGEHAVGQVKEMLKQRGYAGLCLYTDQSNHRAVACYRKCGFRIVERLTEEMANGKRVPRYQMALAL